MAKHYLKEQWGSNRDSSQPVAQNAKDAVEQTKNDLRSEAEAERLGRGHRRWDGLASDQNMSHELRERANELTSDFDADPKTQDASASNADP